MIKAAIILHGLLFVLMQTAVFAQAPDTLWTRTYGVENRANECWGAIQMPDGGAILVGTSTEPAILSWLYVIRINSEGDTLWTRTYEDGTAGRAIAATPDGGFLILATVSSVRPSNTESCVITAAILTCPTRILLRLTRV